MNIHKILTQKILDFKRSINGLIDIILFELKNIEHSLAKLAFQKWQDRRNISSIYIKVWNENFLWLIQDTWIRLYYWK